MLIIILMIPFTPTTNLTLQYDSNHMLANVWRVKRQVRVPLSGLWRRKYSVWISDVHLNPT